MDELNYTKFKDASPADTVYKIRNIMHGLGVMTIDDWIESGIEGCYSLRVTIAGTGMSTNGKGTNPEYALASAYAELIERMQNRILYLGDLSDRAVSHGGFLIAPDEKVFSYDEIAKMDNAMTEYVISRTKTQSAAGAGAASNMHSGSEFAGDSVAELWDRLETVKNWTVFNPPGNPSCVVTVPFYSIKNRKVQYLQYDMYSSIYGSNGMCAGNTPEEALVQGMSEIFERYVNKKLITGKITPPTIPDSYLMKYPGLYRIIQNIQRSGRYKVIVKDCSLGRKYPVVGTMMIDTLKGTFGMKLGVHPSFQIALERTITEAFQGRNIDIFTQSCRIGFEDKALNHRDNSTNIAKIGAGYYPVQLLSDKYSYEFQPFMDNPPKQNGEMLNVMIKLVAEQGYDILVRDVSFLGFPSYQIIVPGFSEMYPVDMLRARELKTYTAMAKTVDNLGQASNEELERIIRYIRYKKNSLIENQMTLIIGRPLVKSFPGGTADVEFFMAVCLYKLGRQDEACRAFGNVAAVHENSGDYEYCYYSCVTDYIKAKSTGLLQEEIAVILHGIYPGEIVKRVVYQLGDPEFIFERIYPGFNCWNCWDCSAGEYCCYKETERVLNAVKEGYAANPVNQERLAEVFKDIY